MNDVMAYSWILEDDAQTQRLLDAIGVHFDLAATGETSRRVTYLDTFDWRIWRKGDVLEYHEFNRQKKLIWRSIDHAETYVEIPLDECPVFINEIADWLRPKKLLKITRPRALVEQALSRVQARTYDLRDRQEKVVCRLSIVQENVRHNNNRKGEALPVRLELQPIKGYDTALGHVIAIINDIGLHVYGRDPLTRLLNLEERRPCDYSNRLRLQLQPLQRTDEASRQIMLQLIGIMEINEHGIRDDIDTEFLHDYRQAIQRAHSLLRQLKQVIPESTRTRFDKDLVWINQETAELYELNNWLLGFERYRKLLNKKQRPDLDEFLGWLRTQRHRALLKVVQLLDNDNYRRFMKRWRVFLECEVPEHSVLKRAEKPIYRVAGRQIWKTYQKLGLHRDADVIRLLQRDLQDLHETCTTLIDLLTLSRTLYNDPAIAPVLDALKGFQLALDRCLDAQNDTHAMQGFVREMKSEGFKKKRTAKAMQALKENLQERQTVCLQELQSAYAAVLGEDMHETFKQLFKAL